MSGPAISRRGLWLAGLAIPTVQLLADGTPAAGFDPPAVRDYRPGEPIVLIGHGDHTLQLAVDALPTDRYGVITVASGSDGPMTCELETPAGERRPVFAADGEDAWTGPLLLDALGTFTVVVRSAGPWAVIIR